MKPETWANCPPAPGTLLTACSKRERRVSRGVSPTTTKLSKGAISQVIPAVTSPAGISESLRMPPPLVTATWGAEMPKPAAK